MLSNTLISTPTSLKIQQKKKLRSEYSALRNTLNLDQVKKASKKILTNLEKIPQFQQAESFFIYVAVGNEIKTQEIITKLLDQNKIVTVPKIVKNKTMIPVQIFNLSSLQKNRYGILEPASNKKYSKKIDMAIVPGVAFTAEGDRLGMGGGYYDKFLAENSAVYSIAVGYDFQIVKELPITQRDKRVSQVITSG
jgi:5-formyltetrahydrofolate cyclo-ligase